MNRKTNVLVYVLPFLVLAWGASVSRAADAGSLVGDWNGTLDAGSAQVPLVLHVQKGEDGSLEATLDSPSQGVEGLPVAAVTLNGAKAMVDVQVIGAVFEGTLSDDGKALEGEWRQNGIVLPLVLKKSGG